MRFEYELIKQWKKWVNIFTFAYGQGLTVKYPFLTPSLRGLGSLENQKFVLCN